MPRFSLVFGGGLLLLSLFVWSALAPAGDKPDGNAAAADDAGTDDSQSDETDPDAPGFEAAKAAAEADAAQSADVKKVLSKDPPGMKRLQPDADVWIDPKNKRVVMDGVVSLRAGTLEMFACLKGTKEHESIVAVDTKAFPVHVALMAVGAEAGSPVRFQPKYRPPTGTPVDITVIWKDDKGKDHHARAQDWIRNLRTHKPFEYTWVFAGSGFFEDEEGNKHYQAEGVTSFASRISPVPCSTCRSKAAREPRTCCSRHSPSGFRPAAPRCDWC